MARFFVSDGELLLKLNPVEQLAALRRSVRAPFAAVKSVRVDQRPWSGVLLEARMGFAAAGAPGNRLITAGPRAKTADGADLVAFVYLNRPSVVVDVDDGGRRMLIVASARHPERVARAVRGR